MDVQLLDDAVVCLLLRLQSPLLALDDGVADHKGEDDDDAGYNAEDAASCHDDREEDQHVQWTRHALGQLGD